MEPSSCVDVAYKIVMENRLNQNMKPTLIASSTAQDLNPAPIVPDWIESGKPEAFTREIIKSKDGTTQFLIWHCSAGSFNWHYGCDEALVVIAGETFITLADEDERRLGPGDMAYFPAGTSARWRIPRYVRKVAVLRPSLPKPISFPARAWGRLLSALGAHSGF
jgi:uncharacterized cupin superfamily protein